MINSDEKKTHGSTKRLLNLMTVTSAGISKDDIRL